MPKKKQKEPEESDEEEEEKEEEEESELEEEIEDVEINEGQFRRFLTTQSTAPVLERTIQQPLDNSLEEEIEAATPSKKEEEKEKYEPQPDYEERVDYEEQVIEGQRQEISRDRVSQVPRVSSINFETVGRQRQMPGQQTGLVSPEELTSSSDDYEPLKPKKSQRFRGEKTSFQENLERRYETK
jgi:hypothetical protein